MGSFSQPHKLLKGIRMIRNITLALGLALLGGWAVLGEDAAKSQADPQSTFEPRSDPGAGQKFLEAFAGDWAVTKTFYPRTGDPVKTPGTCRQTMIHADRFLKSEFVFQSLVPGQKQGEETTGLGIIGWDASTKKFTSIWTDSRSTRISIRQSEEPFDGKQIVLTSRSLDEAPGANARKSKTITRLEDDGRKIVHRQYTVAPSGEERLVMELILTLKPKAEQTAP
jgi:hypothetical protein